MCTHNQLSATLLQDSSAKQSACILWVFLDASAPLSVCLWPSLPSLCGTAGLIDNFICSWREEGDEYMTYPFSGMMEDGGWRGCFFFSKFPFFPLPGRTSGPLHANLFLTVTNELIFWKALGRSLGKRGVGAFSLPQESSCMPVRWCLFPLPNCFCYFLLYKWDQLCLAQQGDSQHILGMMGSFCTRFEWCGLQQLSYHSSRRGNMRCGGLLPVTDLIYMNAGDWHCVSIIFLSWASYCFPRVSLPRFVCVCTCEMQMLCEIPVHTLSRNNTGLCCQVWTGASPSRPQPCLFFPPIPLRFTAVALAVPHSWEQ